MELNYAAGPVRKHQRWYLQGRINHREDLFGAVTMLRPNASWLLGCSQERDKKKLKSQAWSSSRSSHGCRLVRTAGVSMSSLNIIAISFVQHSSLLLAWTCSDSFALLREVQMKLQSKDKSLLHRRSQSGSCKPISHKNKLKGSHLSQGQCRGIGHGYD